MNIIVCVKQVPDTAEIKIDPVTNTLMRDGVQSIMNPYDKYALEMALELKDTMGAKVTVLTMGPPQAVAILKDAIAMGADDVALISDRAFAGSDTLATSHAMVAAVKHVRDFDLILCGKQAIDGDTAQVGPEMAEHLNLPQVTGATKIRIEDAKVLVDRDNETTVQTIAVPLPALITVARSEKEPRFASIKGKMKARKMEIPTWSAADMNLDVNIIGLNGSPTKVVTVFTPPVAEISSEIFHEEDPQVAVDKLVGKLLEARIIAR
ncbi:MAG: electron transfer flavoprotein subunit beta/FixA family protein [Acidaminococcaceae bacterium]|nr:electron transfer flavoprotein subunit beta/FixA family protein [Acidaminococcaceae bacterium]